MQRVIIYHTSDLHAARNFGDRLASLVEPGSLLVDCGDSLAGSSVFYRSREPVIDELRKAPYDAMAVGNREFHYLHGLFSARARRLRAPLVCSNLIDLRRRKLVFARDLHLTRNGVRIRLLALLVPQYRTGSGWERVFGWRFLAPDIALTELLQAPTPDEITILLSHLGFAQDEGVADRFGNLAAIFGGHSHDAFAQPRITNGVPIMHPGAHAAYVGRAELEVNGSTSRICDYRLIRIANE